jgi:hypothetical protein
VAGAGFGRLMIFLAVFFLLLSRRSVGQKASGPFLLLNASTALTFLTFFLCSEVD